MPRKNKEQYDWEGWIDKAPKTLDELRCHDFSGLTLKEQAKAGNRATWFQFCPGLQQMAVITRNWFMMATFLFTMGIIQGFKPGTEPKCPNGCISKKKGVWPFKKVVRVMTLQSSGAQNPKPIWICHGCRKKQSVTHRTVKGEMPS